MEVVYQPDGGFVVPERCIVAHVEGALARGAVLRARERVLEWEETESGVRIRTERGAVEAERLVLTAGAWSQDVARLPAGWCAACASRSPGSSRRVPRSSRPTACPSSTSRSTASTSTASRLTASRASSSAAMTTSVRSGDPGRDLARADARGRGAAPCVRRALLPRRRRADRRAQDLPLRAVTRRALPHRPPPGRRGGSRRRRLLGARLQVLLRRGRDPRRPGARRRDAARHRLCSASTASARGSLKLGRPLESPSRKRVGLSSAVRAGGLEPPRAEAQRDLNPPRLPVPPRPRERSVGRGAPRPSSGRRGARTSRACSPPPARRARR